MLNVNECSRITMYDLSGVGLFRTEGIFEIFYKYNMNETYDNINEPRALKCRSICILHESSHHSSEAVYSAVQCKTVVFVQAFG